MDHRLLTFVTVAEKALEEFLNWGVFKLLKKPGLGISVLSNWTVRKELSLDTLKLVNPESLSLTRSFSYIYLPIGVAN